LFGLLLLFWEIGSRSAPKLQAYIPPMSRVFVALGQLAISGPIVQHLGVTFGRFLEGYLLAAVLGVFLGVVLGYFRSIQSLLSIVIEFLRPMPSVAIIPVAVLMLGIGDSMIVAVTVYASIWPILVNTIDGGRYSMHLPARPNSPVYGVAGTLAVMWAWLDGYDYNVQLVGGSAAENQVDFRLVRPRRIDAGGSVTVAIERDSSLCADFDINFNVKSRCESVYISAATAGTMTIEARSVSPGGVVPIVQTGYYPVSAAPGILSLQVKAGQSYWIRLEVPVEAAPQQYLVLTSMQSSIR